MTSQIFWYNIIMVILIMLIWIDSFIYRRAIPWELKKSCPKWIRYSPISIYYIGLKLLIKRVKERKKWRKRNLNCL